MATQIDTSAVGENALFLFNPLPWPRKALAEVIVSSEWKSHGPMYLQSKDGHRIAAQWRPSPSMTNFFPRLSAMVDLPASGYRMFELKHGEAPVSEKYGDFFELSENGFGIESLKAPDGTELLSAPIGLVVIRDTSDTWAHDIAQFRDEIGRPRFESSSVVENGPLMRITRHRARWQDSEIVLNM